MMTENKIGMLWLDFILHPKSPCLPTGKEEHKFTLSGAKGKKLLSFVLFSLAFLAPLRDD